MRQSLFYNSPSLIHSAGIAEVSLARTLILEPFHSHEHTRRRMNNLHTLSRTLFYYTYKGEGLESGIYTIIYFYFTASGPNVNRSSIIVIIKMHNSSRMTPVSSLSLVASLNINELRVYVYISCTSH